VKDIRDVIADLDPLVQGLGIYFRTGNPATKFVQADRYVAWRLHGLMVKKRTATCMPLSDPSPDDPETAVPLERSSN
jgi:Group II intron, maturase-specific domain